jgi:carboxyl-terminal processing protease
MRADIRDKTMRLRMGEKLLFSRPVPDSAEPLAWARVAAELQAVAFEASTPMQAAGTGGVIRGFFDELFNHLDPYSRYTPPEEAEDDRTRRAGQAGIGLSLARKGSQIIVQGAISDSPAAAEGISAGDVLLTVDGQSTRGKDVATVINWLQGPEDTGVTLSWRGRDGKVRGAAVTRALIPPNTVFASRQGNLLVVRISDFNNATGQRVANELEVGLHGERPAQGVVIDLRGNRGGVLRQAVSVADSLLGPGIVASTIGRDPDANRVLRSANGDIAEYLPVVVLVDGRTASSAEVLAAALGDRGRAAVVGSATLGKGLVQTIAPLPDGGELRVTWSRIIAPRGWPIQTLGVLPQICTSLGQEALNRQIDILSAGGAPMTAALAAHHAARAPITAQQALVLRAPCPAAEGRDNDMSVARLLVENPALHAAALLPPLRDASADGGAPKKP